MILIQGRNHRCFEKRRQTVFHIRLLCFQTLQMAKRSSAFSLSTNFNSIPYQKKWKKAERSRKRERTAKKVDHHFRDDFEKNEPQAHILGPPAKRVD